MAMLHRARVCAVGKEEDMIRLCKTLLQNVNALPSEEDRAPLKLDELISHIAETTHEYESPEDTFSYNMIAPIRFGDAVPGTCRLTFREETCGAWTACFAFDSQNTFQTHEWLDLHKRCGNLLFVAQRAAWSFGLDKGEMIFAGGEVMDNWNAMNECWLWLIPQYECGYPPEEAAERLEKLSLTLDREDSDMTVDELLKSCMDHLNALALETDNPDQLRKRLSEQENNRDFMGLMETRHIIAESVLWEIEHNAKWLACLETVRAAWHQRLAGEGLFPSLE